ncbi:MAG: hypothetical protein IT342_10540 [Candidatus Melainabacteria bacterium]|nr:hypothetical protein [Candidatus Melainabacteria bacterium]
MAKLYTKWVYLIVALCFLVAVSTFLYLISIYTKDHWIVAMLGGTVLLIFGAVYRVMSRSPRVANSLEVICQDAEEMHKFVESLSPGKLALAIAISAALGLLLELSLIRWQGTLFLVFAYYKNFSLLSCFAGLGLGYAASKQKQIPFLLVIPLLALQFFFLTTLRFSLGETLNSVLQIMPVSEQYHLHLSAAHSAAQFGVVYFFLSTVFLLTALTLMPVGQLCGALMEREKPLKAYGLNLAGSLLGVLLSFALSYFWTPPTVWFAVALLCLLFFLGYKTRAMLVGGVASLVAIGILAWPVSYLAEVVYSPYQKVERTCNTFGWMFIKAAGQYYQRVADLSEASVKAFPKLESGATSYNLPYTVFGKKPESVAIMAAGTGNDVAAALRNGAGHVDAVEIDPSIIGFGKAYHPEHPYDNPNVNAVLDDARAFMRKTKNQYDVISYSALDSHSLLSHASSLRLDSYVYTVESFRDARVKLKPGGLLSMSFDATAPELLAKIRLMMIQAFDGKPPACIAAKDAACSFMQTREGDIKLPATLFSNPNLHDATEQMAKLSSEGIDVSTDDWPFFYMYRRVYPYSYMAMFGVVALLTGLLAMTFGSTKVSKNSWSFAFLGAGFMLVETKAITELSLAFSNTWYVVGIVIASIMIMAFCANLVVSRLNLRNSILPFVLLLISLGIGYFVAQSGWLPASDTDKVLQIVILTMPLFFSGMAFSILFGRANDVGSAMSMNLLGAMLGGLLEYNAMYFGYKALYLIALGIYAVAFVLSFIDKAKESPPAEPGESAG